MLSEKMNNYGLHVYVYVIWEVFFKENEAAENCADRFQKGFSVADISVLVLNSDVPLIKFRNVMSDLSFKNASSQVCIKGVAEAGYCRAKDIVTCGGVACVSYTFKNVGFIVLGIGYACHTGVLMSLVPAVLLAFSRIAVKASSFPSKSISERNISA